MDKGTTSNLISAVVLAGSFLIPQTEIQSLVLTAGMFAFSGGVTNSLAVKMFFDRVPGLIGSGVIPARFREIRREIKRLIMEHFFSEEYLREFLARQAKDVDWMRYVKQGEDRRSPVHSFLEEHWERLTSRESLKPVISSSIDRVMGGSAGSFLQFLGKQTIEQAVGKFVDSFLDEIKGRVFAASAEFQKNRAMHLEVDEEAITCDLREQVDVLLEQKLEQLDAAQVKKMMEKVIRSHLGWLVVWGNIFGGLLGVIAHFVHRSL